ncbi:MAG TPA: helix-turn-helix domain-containing protein [Candidatus Dormibacteraeota bacterium]|jgi:DNA-binding phage protein|nr:helix-turn-helix domain-containing protein [Candidatus Dormibacteraeota bacterium]
MATLDTSRFHRVLDEQLQDPEFRVEYERAQAMIEQVDAVINALDQLRVDHGRSKAELARQIGKNPAAIRRFFTTEGNPELRTVAALAEALNAEIRIVPRRPSSRGGQRTRRTQPVVTT